MHRADIIAVLIAFGPTNLRDPSHSPHLLFGDTVLDDGAFNLALFDSKDWVL